MTDDRTTRRSGHFDRFEFCMAVEGVGDITRIWYELKDASGALCFPRRAFGGNLGYNEIWTDLYPYDPAHEPVEIEAEATFQDGRRVHFHRTLAAPEFIENAALGVVGDPAGYRAFGVLLVAGDGRVCLGGADITYL